MGNDVKILVLGTDSRGKASVSSLIRWLYLPVAYTDKERSVYSEQVQRCCVENMQELVQRCPLVSPKNRAAADQLLDLEEPELSLPGLVAGIAALWTEPGIWEACDDGYFFEHWDRISQPDYKASNRDIQKLNPKSETFDELSFVHQGMHFRMCTLGGTRYVDWKRFFHMFQDVTCVLFVVDISEYDEDGKLDASLEAFEEAVNSRWLSRTSVLLFLNNTDVFRKKIAKTSLRVCLPAFDGPDQDYTTAVAYIVKLFISRNHSSQHRREIYSHETCETDTECIRVLTGTVEDIFLSQNLRTADFNK